MVTTDEIGEYLNTLNSMQIFRLRGRLVDKKANLIRQNLEPSHEFLVVLNLLGNKFIIDSNGFKSF